VNVKNLKKKGNYSTDSKECGIYSNVGVTKSLHHYDEN